MGIMFGLLAAFGWGIADYLVSSVTRRVGSAQAMLYIQTTGLVAIMAVLAVQFSLPQAPALTWAIAVGLGVVNLLGTVLIYRSYAIGTLSLVSPISSSFAVVTALLALTSGERPSPLALFGSLLLITGVVVVTKASGHELAGHTAPQTARGRFGLPRMGALPPGVPEAIGVAFCFGVYFWGLNFVTPGLGNVWPILLSRLVAAAGVLAALRYRGTIPVRPPMMLWPIVLITAAMDTVAFLAFNIGLGTTDTAIVTALASLFSAVTIVLAGFLLRERLSRGQWAGVGVILAGVLLVSV